MTDNKSAVGQPYELFMFARKHGLSLSDAREILDSYGANREGADAAAIVVKNHDLRRRTKIGDLRSMETKGTPDYLADRS